MEKKFSEDIAAMFEVSDAELRRGMEDFMEEMASYCRTAAISIKGQTTIGCQELFGSVGGNIPFKTSCSLVSRW